MDFATIEGFPSLKDTLSEPIKRFFSNSLSHKSHQRHLNLIYNVYSVFVDTQSLDTKHVQSYAALDVFSSEEQFQKHVNLLTGFIYEEFSELSVGGKYRLARPMVKLFENIAFEMRFSSFYSHSILQGKVSEDMLVCISQYQASPKNIKKIQLYRGWKLISKFDNMLRIHLANIHSVYGTKFTNDIFVALKNYAKKQKSTTLNRIIGDITPLLNTIAQLYPTEDKTRKALSVSECNHSFLEILGAMIADNQAKGLSIENFLNSRWVNMLNDFTKIFVDTQFFDEPRFDLIKPKYKTPKNSHHSISTGGGLNKSIRVKLLSEISLSISDNEAIEIIADRINREIDHVKLIAQEQVNVVVSRHRRNKKLILEGNIRMLPACNSGNSTPVGINNFPNILATFEHYTWGMDSQNIPETLQAPASFLLRELNIPTQTNIFCFLALLIIEHPQITPSWIANWELFNSNGKQVGYKQVGTQDVIVSCKQRRGVSNAEQLLILNVRSKALVEHLIVYTQIIRGWLKSQNDNNWRFMCLHCESIGSKPTSMFYGSRKKMDPLPAFSFLFDKASFDNKGDCILSEQESRELAKNINLRPIRSSRALQIYFESHSVLAMSEALGHKQLDSNLLTSYLPDVLLEYFNNRWIRIFQNSIICKAMKGSPYLNKAVDLTKDELEVFMQNHGIGELPEHIKKGKQVASDLNAEPDAIKGSCDKLVILFSVPLLQVLIAIMIIIEASDTNEELPEFFSTWYEVACFLIKNLSMGVGSRNSTISEEAKLIYDIAKANPLCLSEFKDALCR